MFYKRSRTSNAKATLDKWFSLYIRLRDSDANGYGRCISCGKLVHYKDADCGHFINRQHMNTRYDERNCNLQCTKCNRFDEGNNVGYMQGLVKKYGEGVIQELTVKKHLYRKFSEFEFKELIKHYKREVKKLQEEKTTR